MAMHKTHTGIVVYPDGEKRVKLHMNPTTWVVGAREYYYRETGRRGGGFGGRAKLRLETIKEIFPAGGSESDKC